MNTVNSSLVSWCVIELRRMIILKLSFVSQGYMFWPLLTKTKKKTKEFSEE